ncbi:hypothetical protein [Salinicoccus sp. CNSTN-B1]
MMHPAIRIARWPNMEMSTSNSHLGFRASTSVMAYGRYLKWLKKKTFD